MVTSVIANKCKIAGFIDKGDLSDRSNNILDKLNLLDEKQDEKLDFNELLAGLASVLGVGGVTSLATRNREKRKRGEQWSEINNMKNIINTISTNMPKKAKSKINADNT